MSLQFLVVGSETADEREARRSASGASSAESYAKTLRSLEPDCRIRRISCVEPRPDWGVASLQAFDAVFFAGSPIQMNVVEPDTRAATDFMREVFASGVPSFGSCAGLQIATVAAGGAVRQRKPRPEAGFARRIVATKAGAAHPLLAGRPPVWDALTMHSVEVSTLPPGATVLAQTRGTAVQALEIRHGAGVFWGVQYHPELDLAEIAASLRRECEDLVEEGFAPDGDALRDFADEIDALGRQPGRRDLAWRLGLDEEITDDARRRIELRNFIDALAALKLESAA